MTNTNGQSAIDAAAASLVARSGDDADAADCAEALAWAAQDPRHAVALARARRAWSTAARLQVRRDDAARWQTPSRWTLDALIGRRRAIAAMVSSAAFGTALIVSVQLLGRTERHATDALPSRVVLADGSTVVLDAFSSIEVSIRRDQRFVRLLHGGALFTVSRDRTRAFVVEAEATRMVALGTAFDVRLSPQLTDLTVTEGTVRVSTETGAAAIRAGEAAAVSGQAVVLVDLDDATIARRLAWRDGVLQFDGETLAQASAAFNRYRAKPLVVGDPAIAGLTVVGRYRTGDAEAFAAALARRHGIRSVRSADGTIMFVGPRRAKREAADDVRDA